MKSDRDLGSKEVRALSPGEWGGGGLVSEGGSLGVVGLGESETDGWAEAGGKEASVKEIGRDDWPSMGCTLGEKGSEAVRGCSSNMSEGPATAVLEGKG